MSDLRVLRLCSVFEPPPKSIVGKGSRFDPIGGMQNHAAELTRALDRHGLVQTVITTRPPGARRVELIGAAARVVRLGLPIRPLRQLYSAPALFVAQRVAAKVDLVHVHLGEDLAILPIALAAALPRRLPVVLTIHCSLRHTLRVVDARTALLKRVGGWIEKRGAPRADAIITITERLADLLVAGGIKRERVHVIPPGIDSSLFAQTFDWPFPQIPRPRIVFVGRLVASKGVQTLVQAAARLSAREAHVALVADGPERRSLQQRINELGLSGKVHICGFVPHELVPTVLAHADVVVLPSVYEELGTVLLECFQLGVPVIASRVGGIPNVVAHGGNGLLVPPADPAALASAIDRVLEDGDLAARLGEAGRRCAARYEWNQLVREILAVYRQVTER